MLLNPYRFGSAGVSLTGLVSYWKMDEASGTALDAHGSNPLSAQGGGGPGSAAGKINTARDFEKDTPNYLNRASNALLQTGDIEFAFTAWIKFESFVSPWMTILSKDNQIAVREYWLAYEHGSARLRFMIWPTGANASEISVAANALGTPSVGVWYFIVCWHDPVANKIYIQVNNGAVNETAGSGGAFVGASEFRIGAMHNATNLPFDGLIDEVGFWKRILTPAERTELYNSGNGKTYPFT